MHTLFPATLLILAALTAPAVQAGASATTRIVNITLAVLDLTPQDGSVAGNRVCMEVSCGRARRRVRVGKMAEER